MQKKKIIKFFFQKKNIDETSFPVQHTCIVLYLLYVCDVTALIIQTLEKNVIRK